MSKEISFYTKEETNEMISILSSGELNLNEVSRQLSKKYGRSAQCIRFKLYSLKKRMGITNKKINSEIKVKEVLSGHSIMNFEPDLPKTKEQKPADIGVDVPHGMTFEGKPKRITLHSDHFRIYF
jgi:hypothetical protein